LNWIKEHWKDLFLTCLSIILIYSLINSVGLSIRANKYENLYYETYRELVLAQRNLELRSFEDYGTMEEWVHSWVESKMYSLTGIWSSFSNLLNKLITGRYLWDCTDIAEEMVIDARQDGYLVSECLVGKGGLVYGVKVSNFEYHMGCLTYLDGYYWYIEPQTGSIVRIVNRLS